MICGHDITFVPSDFNGRNLGKYNFGDCMTVYMKLRNPLIESELGIVPHFNNCIAFCNKLIQCYAK